MAMHLPIIGAIPRIPTATNKVSLLYKKIMREVPKIMMLYDIMDKSPGEVKEGIRKHFYKHTHLKDPKVIEMLVDRGYYDLSDTLMQHKQKNHLMFILEGFDSDDPVKKQLNKYSTADEQFYGRADPF